jgi:hypothetical protein
MSRQIIIAREGSSRLGVLLGLPTLFLIDMLHVISEGFDT